MNTCKSCGKQIDGNIYNSCQCLINVLEPQMKQYFLFAYDQYYPSGGLGDFRGMFDSFEEADDAARNFAEKDHIEILDTATGIHWYSHRNGPWEQKNPDKLGKRGNLI